MRIGELSRLAGVSADTIRFYERSGWLPAARRRDNAYRDYGEADLEHVRLMIELRRLEVPLDTAARIASWCRSGHCGETTVELPRLIGERRSEIASRIEGLRALDARLADLERHLTAPAGIRQRAGAERSERASARSLPVTAPGGPCCTAADAVLSTTSSVACGGCSPASD